MCLTPTVSDGCGRCCSDAAGSVAQEYPAAFMSFVESGEVIFGRGDRQAVKTSGTVPDPWGLNIVTADCKFWDSGIIVVKGIGVPWLVLVLEWQSELPFAL